MDKLLNAKALINLGVFFLAGYGVGQMVHLAASWSIVLALAFVVANQVGLHQEPPAGA